MAALTSAEQWEEGQDATQASVGKQIVHHMLTADEESSDDDGPPRKPGNK